MFIKMKRYLLSLFIVPLLLIGSYSFAYVVNDNVNVSSYPYRYSLTDNWFNNTITVKNWNNCAIWNWHYSYAIDNWTCTNSCTFNSSTFSSNNNNLQLRCDSPFDIVISYDNWEPAPLVPWWTANFTPVITGLTGSINEFIPYVVYIGLWVLGVLIWFVAIKRLINWVRAKIFSSFK